MGGCEAAQRQFTPGRRSVLSSPKSGTMKTVIAITLLAALYCCACSAPDSEKAATKLIYFGLEDHSEARQPEIKISLAKTWANNVCPHWQATVNEQDADYKVLFGTATVTILGRKGEIIYTGGQGVMYLPKGNPDGSGTNICRLTGGK